MDDGAIQTEWLRGPPWGELSSLWMRLVPGTNLDWLPDWLCPVDGCPACGSVYATLERAKVMSLGTLGQVDEAEQSVVHFVGNGAVVAVRLRCNEGHLVEFDGKELKLVRWPTWALAGVAVGLVGVGYALMRKATP